MLKLLNTLFVSVGVLAMSTASAVVIDPVEMEMSNPAQLKMNHMIALIDAKIAFPLDVPVIIQGGRRAIDADLQREYAAANSATYAITGSALVNASGQWTRNADRAVEKCITMLTTRGLLAVGEERDSMLAHESFHCFIQRLSGSLRNANSFSPWLSEGAPTFVGEHNVPSMTANVGEFYLNKYATEYKSLFERSYDAYPFFYFLNENGVNVYSVFRTIFQDTNRTTANAWQHITAAASEQTLARWGMSFARKPEWGTDWDIKIRGMTPRAVEYPVSVSDGSALPIALPGVQGLPRHDQVFLAENTPVEIYVENGVAGVNLDGVIDGGSTHTILSGQNLKICFGANCGCSGGGSDPSIIRVNSPIVYLSAVSTTANHTLHIRRTQPTCCNKAGQFDSRMVGTWETDTKNLLDAWWPAPHIPGQQEKSHQGNIRIRISADGLIIKDYANVSVQNRIYKRDGHYAESQMWLTGSVSGCVSTRAIDDRKGWLYIDNYSDTVSQRRRQRVREDQPDKFADQPGEWFQSAICAGSAPCKGNFYFEDGKVRFAGIGASKVYSNLVRISD